MKGLSPLACGASVMESLMSAMNRNLPVQKLHTGPVENRPSRE
jgi:hypothetical protein